MMLGDKKRKILYINMLYTYIFYTDTNTDFKIICILYKGKGRKKRLQEYRYTVRNAQQRCFFATTHHLTY